MTNGPAKEYPQIDPHRKVFTEFMEEFTNESDRACVVLGSAKIETLLRNLLEKFFVSLPASTDDLLDGDSPLSTFSSRIKAAHRIGLIDSTFAKLLHIFRKLRNSFAHEITGASLTTGAARDRVLALTDPFHGTTFFQSLAQLIATKTERQPDDIGVLFRTVITVFYIHLHRTIEGTSQVQVDTDWKIVNVTTSIPEM